MAATIARAFGNDSTRTKETHRLGGQSSTAQANTWSTFATAHVDRSGAGYLEVRRDGEKFRLEWSGESSPLSATILAAGSARIPQVER